MSIWTFVESYTMDQQAWNQSSKTDSNHATCAMCGTIFVRDDSRYLPFCSHRCQIVDLSKWLDEEYGMPFEGESSQREVSLEQDPDD